MTSGETRSGVGQQRVNTEWSAHEMRAAGQSGSVARDTRGTAANPARGLSASLATAYLAGCLAVSLGVAVLASCSAKAGAVESVSWGTARPHDTVSVAPARAERVGNGGQGRTNPSEPERKSSSVGEFDEHPAKTSALPPVAHDYTGSERVVPAALWSAVVAHFPESERMHALRIAYCESRYRTDAVSNEGARGLFQVMPVHGDVPSDADGQTAQAARIQREHSWSVWDCK